MRLLPLLLAALLLTVVVPVVPVADATACSTGPGMVDRCVESAREALVRESAPVWALFDVLCSKTGMHYCIPL